MPLDPQAQMLLESVRASGIPPFHTLPVEDARQAMIDLFGKVKNPVSVHRIDNRDITGPAGPIPIRLYIPAGVGPFPVLVYYHGGGWVLGSLETHDPMWRELSRVVGCVVVSVDYRLAPEHRFPVPLEDCYAAVDWVARHASDLNIDAQRIAVGGDSAGGNLAAAVALTARDRGTPPLACQLLIYPALDYAFDTHSYRENGNDYFLTKDMMVWFWQRYLHDQEHGLYPQASPLRAQNLYGLPSTLLLTAEFDPRRDEGKAYAERLRAVGVQVEYRCYAGMIHGFLGWTSKLDVAAQAMVETAETLRIALNIRTCDRGLEAQDTPETQITKQQDAMVQHQVTSPSLQASSQVYAWETI
ncbi:lipase [Candidatus Entotheonella serta]|nr:lipase [Candidatus Entotheonella serta]